jgi:1,4-dihydroxy-2-naphthoyl-CoA hydrolase
MNHESRLSTCYFFIVEFLFMSFSYHRTVRFQDTDAAGVVYFANLLSICHEAYEESLRTSDINLKDFFTNPQVAFPIVHASVDFLRPLFCGDKLLVSLMPQKVGAEKFEINYEITLSDVLAAKAITRHVCIDANTRNKQALPTNIVYWLERNRRETEEAERRKARELIS